MRKRDLIPTKISPLVEELHEGVPAGICIICERSITARVGKGRKRRVHIGECSRTYRLVHRAALKEFHRLVAEASRLIARAAEQLNT